MASCGEYIRSQFPTIDDDLYQYVQGTFPCRGITYATRPRLDPATISANSALTLVLVHAGILDSSKDDFEDGDEVYEAIGQVLHEVTDKSENEVRSVNVFAFVIL